MPVESGSIFLNFRQAKAVSGNNGKNAADGLDSIPMRVDFCLKRRVDGSSFHGSGCHNQQAFV
jgi:hypothetical protein